MEAFEEYGIGSLIFRCQFIMLFRLCCLLIIEILAV